MDCASGEWRGRTTPRPDRCCCRGPGEQECVCGACQRRAKEHIRKNCFFYFGGQGRTVALIASLRFADCVKECPSCFGSLKAIGERLFASCLKHELHNQAAFESSCTFSSLNGYGLCVAFDRYGCALRRSSALLCLHSGRT